jgi:hypothetical protein
MQSKPVGEGAEKLQTVRGDRIARSLSDFVSRTLRDRGAPIFVWTVWLVMLLFAWVFMVNYGRKIPLAEDWLIVPSLTGNDPNLFGWLWSQNNEHRIPVPRLIMLILLQITNGDFRAGGFFNVIVLGALAFACILVARHLRGGRTSVTDAFFPLVLLHVGHSANLLMGWQVVFVVPTALTFVVLLVLVSCRTLATPIAAVLSGTCLMLFPLNGINGLLFVPLVALWLSYCGVLNGYAVKNKGGKLWISGFLIGSAAIALLLTALYFVGYEHPTWNPPSPGPGMTLQTTVRFAALGFGPIVSGAWGPASAIAIAVLFSSAIVVLLGFLKHKDLEKHRALSILLFFGNLLAFALAMGYGRAGLVPTSGLPVRYVLLAVPALCAAFFIWELYGSPKLRTTVQRSLFLLALLLLPFNTVAGFYDFGNWYRQGMEAVKQDINAGTPRSVLAKNHRDFLIHWWDETQLADNLKMLHDSGIEPFDRMREDPVNSSDPSAKE